MIRLPLDPITLSDRHVRLEPIEAGHLPGLAAIAGDPGIWTWMPMDASPPGAIDRLVRQAIGAREAGSQLPFVVRLIEGGRVVGSTRYLNIMPADRGLEIGWTWYARDAWAGAVNPACKRLLLAHAFEVLGAVRVGLRCDARNGRSHDAILRLGAVREGVLRRHKLVRHGVIRDTVQFSILEEEWPAVRAKLDARLSVFGA